MRLRLDLWDGLDADAGGTFLCEPRRADDDTGALLITLPDKLFSSGQPRAVKAPHPSAARGGLANFDT